MRITIDREALARDVLDYLKIKGETGAERDSSLFLAELLRREGFEPQLDVVEADRPNVYVRVAGAEPGAPSLLFNGHTDTIPIGNSDPPARDGDWLVGRGAEDMRGGLVAMVHAASALRKAGVRLRGDLWLTGVIDHETPVGRKLGPKRLIERINKGDIKADAIVIVEGPFAVWAASLGSTIFTVTITSGRGIIHTIKVPYTENPACWLGRLLVEFERLERGFAAEGVHPLCGAERVNVGHIVAGDWPNRLPTPITVTGMWRWRPGTTFQQVRAKLEAICAGLAAESGLSFRVEFKGMREPFETPADHPVITAFRGAVEEVTGATADVIGMGLVGDANLFANETGVPTIYWGPAHATAHSDHERVSLTQLALSAEIYAHAAMRFCGAAIELR
ncbi:MAG: M20/M25/M40 family metallo-hydrolase [Bryobacterales bacterium]|nr:M20/M25/M40 family metallo-hydrolase [Bryobacterales bacterium]